MIRSVVFVEVEAQEEADLVWVALGPDSGCEAEDGGEGGNPSDSAEVDLLGEGYVSTYGRTKKRKGGELEERRNKEPDSLRSKRSLGYLSSLIEK